MQINLAKAKADLESDLPEANCMSQIASPSSLWLWTVSTASDVLSNLNLVKVHLRFKPQHLLWKFCQPSTASHGIFCFSHTTQVPWRPLIVNYKFIKQSFKTIQYLQNLTIHAEASGLLSRVRAHLHQLLSCDSSYVCISTQSPILENLKNRNQTLAKDKKTLERSKKGNETYPKLYRSLLPTR